MSEDKEKTESFVLFELAGTTYALPSSEVRQLEMIEHITPVPNAASTVEGVVFSRGQVIPAISLRARFGFPKVPYDLRSRLIVVGLDERVIGLIVDSAREFRNIPVDAINPPPEGLADLSGPYLEAVANVGDNTILILDLAEVLKADVREIINAEG